MSYDNLSKEIEMIEDCNVQNHNHVMEGSTYANCSSDNSSDSDDSLQFDLNEDLNIDGGEIFDLNKAPGDCSIPHLNKDPADCSFSGDGGELNNDCGHLYSSGSGRSIGAAAVPHPEVGMEFSTWDNMNSYYRTYGEQEGFGVVCIGGRKNDVYNKAAYSTYVWKCECYGITAYKKRVNGKRVVVYDEPSKKRKTKKCDCPVMLYGQGHSDGVWQIKKAVNEHNHSVNPELSRHIAMYRKQKITKHLEHRIENDHSSGASVSQIFNNMAGQRHGVENVGFTKKDIHNLVNRKRRLKLKNGDASAMLEYFDRMTADNQNFFHMHRVDHKGRLKDIMWVDARSREAYQYFGDVVCFDSTYLTNQYELPFSNFVGVNHHGQTILLGCALVSHEDAETFEWLFKTWLSCMRGKRPAAIMTDQDAAMRKAIRVVFPMPETRHRWCMWHIMKKFGTKLGALSDYQDVKDALQHVIYNSITPDEFVEAWWEVVNKFKLEQYDCYQWLEGLYEEREMWIPAYVKGVFWAGMQTTQRVESINSFFDGYINRHTRLCEFAPNYCKAMESRANDEQEADANCARFVRPLISEFSLERKFQKVYTDAKFVEVQNQCNRVAYLTLVSKKSVSHNEEEYVFSDRVWIYCKKKKKETPLKGRLKEYTVMYNIERKDGSCDCRHFECHGIICRHIIKVLDMSGVTEVPSMYVLDRWRKDISRKHTLVKVAYHDASKTEEVRRYDKLLLALEPIVLRASASDEAVEVLMDLIQLMSLKVDELHVMAEGSGQGSGGDGEERPSGELEPVKHVPPTPKTPSSVNKGSVVGSADTPNSSTCVKDPEPRGNNKKGRPRATRYVSQAEKDMAKVAKTGGKKKQGCRQPAAGDTQHPSSEFMQQQVVAFPNVAPPSHHHIGDMFPNTQVNQGYYARDPLLFTGSGSGPSPSVNRRMLAGGIQMSQHSEAVGYFTANNAYSEVQFGDGSHFINPAYVPNTSIQRNTHPHMQNPHPNSSLHNT